MYRLMRMRPSSLGIGLITTTSKRFFCDDKSGKLKHCLEAKLSSLKRELEGIKSKLTIADTEKINQDGNGPTVTVANVNLNAVDGKPLPTQYAELKWQILLATILLAGYTTILLAANITYKYYFEKHMEKERYEKEIEQLRDGKKELEQTLSEIEKERDALNKKMEVAQFEQMVSRERVEVNKVSKMPKAMEMDAILCAIKAMKNSEKQNDMEVAIQIRSEFDKKYGPDWHCFVLSIMAGGRYSLSIKQAGDNFILFTVNGKDICLFKTISSGEKLPKN